MEMYIHKIIYYFTLLFQCMNKVTPLVATNILLKLANLSLLWERKRTIPQQKWIYQEGLIWSFLSSSGNSASEQGIQKATLKEGGKESKQHKPQEYIVPKICSREKQKWNITYGYSKLRLIHYNQINSNTKRQTSTLFMWQNEDSALLYNYRITGQLGSTEALGFKLHIPFS